MEKKRNSRYAWFTALVILLACISCEKEDNSKGRLSGLWRCEETGLVSQRTYNIDIASLSSDTTVYKFYNFHNTGFDEWVYVVKDNNLLNIESQLINNGSASISGSGAIGAGTPNINLEYTINEGYGNIEITTILSRL